MAEIRIERRERSALPWLLAGILLLGLLWFLFVRRTVPTVATRAAGSTADSTARDTSREMGRDTATAAGSLAPAPR